MKISRIQKQNVLLITSELKKNSLCKNPTVIAVPTLYHKGSSIFPNQVNSMELTSLSGESHLMAARSFFKPFDEYLENELQKYGIKILWVNDWDYHVQDGDIHCGTNEIRLCR